jgi:hypothetical protein
MRSPTDDSEVNAMRAAVSSRPGVAPLAPPQAWLG